MFTRMWPCRVSEVRFPFASTAPVSGPADTNGPGSPVSCCSAGERSTGSFPVARKVKEPSALFTVAFAGPDVFTTPRSLANDGHAPALQHGSVSADHPAGEVEGGSRPLAAFELHCASAASRRGQRRDRNEFGARAHAVGRVDGPGNGEGG